MKIDFSELNIISAGAGSGKTYTVQQTLSNWLKDHAHEVRPERILAVTFSKMAASEMQSRIRSALLSSGNVEAAMKVASSQISTIHSFGQNIIRSFAYETGISPNVRQLSEAEENILLRLSLSSHSQISEVIRSLEALGYKGKFNGSEFVSALDMLQKRVLQLTSSLRTIGASGEKTKQYISMLGKEVKALYGKTEDADTLNNNLHTAVTALLSSFPYNMKESYGGSGAADSAFTADYKALSKALDISNIQRDWALWKALQSLRLTKVKNDEYIRLATEVMGAAAKLSVHPGPLNDALTHIEILLQISMDTLGKYAEEKQKNALMDFSDMVHLANSTMDDDPWLDEMMSMYDCLVIDEFQDTNPIQFALLWKFRQKGLPTLIVGDIKQSIMGFQGADASLFESLIADTQASQHELGNNWRSTPALMEWINALGKGLYGARYTSLSPKADFTSSLSPLKVIDFDDDNWSANGSAKKGKAGYTRGQYDVIVKHIRNMLDAKEKVYDRHTKESRTIEPSDIAILAPNHKMLTRAAATLRSYGIEAEVKQQGWFQSRIVQIVYHALSYLANPSDKHAALYLLVTELGDMTLQAALEMYLEKKPFEHKLLRTLDEVRAQTKTYTLSGKVIALVEALQLWDYILTHEDNVAQRANLLKLIELGAEFEALQYESLNAMGIYGRNLNAFLTWLAISDNDTQPAPKSINTEAVQLRTWHASKGLEWPVVIVMGMDSDKAPSLPDVSLGYESGSRTDPLSNAYVRFFTSFEDNQTNEKLIAVLNDDAHATVDNLLYVAMTRAREQLILPWPSFKGEGGEFSFMHRLTQRCGMSIEGDGLTMEGVTNDHGFKATVESAKVPDAAIARDQSVLMAYGRVALEPLMDQEKIPAKIFPSGLESAACYDKASVETITYGSEVNIGRSGSNAADLGTLLHHYYHVLLKKPAMKERFLESVESTLSTDTWEHLAQQVQALQQYAMQELDVVQIRCEVPLLNKTAEGSVVSGSIDLLMETEEGYWIIDHKSDTAEDLSGQFKLHYPQLDAYRRVVKLDKPVIGVGINWMRYGSLTLYRVDDKRGEIDE